MKTYRAWLAVWPLLVAGFFPSALAQELASTSSVSTPISTTLVPVRGIVSGSPESVKFSGQAKVASRLARDPDFHSPRLVVSIDLSEVGGVGSTTGATYVIAGPELVQKRVAAAHTIEITFPFQARGTRPRTGLASFALDFDTASGAVIGASGNVSTPSFPR